MAQGDRKYECVVFGATGYTGKYTAEHITTHLPTDFKWAVAGRSEAKLRNVVNELKSLNADRLPPEVEVCQLEKNDLVNLAKKTKVFITTVGPYHKYGTVVVEACAETGTHYLDVTGETPWIVDIIQKYHVTAQKNSAIMIPQDGIESAPADLMCNTLVNKIRDTFGTGTGETIHVVYEMNSAASGGTLATVLSLFDSYNRSQFANAQKPWSLCSAPPPDQIPRKPLWEAITGVRTIPDIGTVSDSLMGSVDIPLIHRSWELFGNYGPRFRMSEYMKTRNAFTGFAFHLTLMAAISALILPPVRWILKRFVYQPGEGPSKEEAGKEYMEWHTIANADVPENSEPKRVFGRMRWEGSMYHLTGVTLAESALIVAREKTYAHELGGGILTPATLGAGYFERLQNAGLKVEVKTMQ